MNNSQLITLNKGIDGLVDTEKYLLNVNLDNRTQFYNNLKNKMQELVWVLDKAYIQLMYWIGDHKEDLEKISGRGFNSDHWYIPVNEQVGSNAFIGCTSIMGSKGNFVTLINSPEVSVNMKLNLKEKEVQVNMPWYKAHPILDKYLTHPFTDDFRSIWYSLTEHSNKKLKQFFNERNKEFTGEMTFQNALYQDCIRLAASYSIALKGFSEFTQSLRPDQPFIPLK